MVPPWCGRKVFILKLYVSLWNHHWLATITEIGSKGYYLNKFETNTSKISVSDSMLFFCNPFLLLVSLALNLGISCCWYTQSNVQRIIIPRHKAYTSSLLPFFKVFLIEHPPKKMAPQLGQVTNTATIAY